MELEETNYALAYLPPELFEDEVFVVRCKKCRYFDPENMHCDHPMGTALPLPRKPDDFCSYGVRKDGEWR